MSTSLESQTTKDLTLIVDVASDANCFVFGATEGDVELVLDGLYFANSSYESDGTQSKIIAAGTSQTLYTNKSAGKMYIKHAQNLNILQFCSCFGSSLFGFF